MYENLNTYIKEESPIKSACLLTGLPGIGKSTILANWYDYMDGQQSILNRAYSL